MRIFRTSPEREKRVVGLMIRLYCRHREGNSELCPDCRALLEYARARLDKCPFGNAKTSCRKCTVHCYTPAMRKRIRSVMRYSGPRMILLAPWAFFKHLIQG